MSTVTVSAEGQRRDVFSTEQLPLTFGAGATAAVSLPGPGGTDVVFTVDNVDGLWLAQPAAGIDGLQLNGAVLVRSTRLAVDDELEYVGTRIRVRVATADNLDVHVVTEASDFVTAPPVMPASASSDDDDEILSTTFKRAQEQVAPVVRKRARWPYAVGGVLALLMGVSGALFTAQSVRFDTVPSEIDPVLLSGGWMKLAVAERYLLRPGNHAVRISAPGYYDHVQRFELADDPLTLRIELEPRPGRVEIAANTETEASVSIDGEIVGAAPLAIDALVPGVYEVAVRAPLYLPWEGAVTVTGRGQTQRIVADLVPAFGQIEMFSEPAGALVTRNEDELGTADGVVRVPEGRQTLTLLLAGYKPARIDVDVLAGESRSLEPITLEPADGRLNVRSRPAGANVTVDGQYRGQTPLELALSPDEQYVIQLSKAGYGRTSRQVKLAAAEGEELFVDLAARSGVVNLDVRPVDAVVIVNGQTQASGKRELRLPASPHRLVIKREGYVDWAETVTPRPGFPQKIAVRLKTLDQARLAKIPQTLQTSQGPVLRYVDPGKFTMGASRREVGRRANETLRQVVLTRPFYLGTREVTNREFRLFFAKHESVRSGGEPLTLAADGNPVVNLTWQEAAAYCNWLSEKDGLTPAYTKKFDKLVPVRPTPNGYRLPTEAEWAWVARFQTGRGYLKFPWGESATPSDNAGNFADQSAKGVVGTLLPGYDDGFAATAPVASFPPNLAGFYDLAGNVAEWVNDYYQVYTPDSTRVYTDPEGPDEARYHVIRGSSWRHATQRVLRLSYRDFGEGRRPDVGFRIARNAPPRPDGST